MMVSPDWVNKRPLNKRISKSSCIHQACARDFRLTPRMPVFQYTLIKHTLPLLFQVDLLEQGLDAVLLVAPPSRLIMDRGPLPSARACQLPVPPAKARRAPCVTDHLPQDAPCHPSPMPGNSPCLRLVWGELAPQDLLCQSWPRPCSCFRPSPRPLGHLHQQSWLISSQRAAGHCGKIALASSQQLSCPDSPPASCSGCLAIPALLSLPHKVGKSETILWYLYTTSPRCAPQLLRQG